MRLLKYFKKKLIKNYLASNLNIGNDTRLGKNSVVLEGAEIGDFTYLNTRSGLGPVFVNGNVKIGKYCSVAPNVTISPGNHPSNFLSTHPFIFDTSYKERFNTNDNAFSIGENKFTIIENDVWIGSNAIISEGIKIGNGAIIAAGSVITKDVPPYSVVGGVPGKIIKYRFQQETIDLIQNSKVKWWDLTPEKLGENIHLFYKEGDIINFIKKINE